MSDRRRRVFTGIGTMFIGLSALGAFFYLYVERQAAYLQGHYLRELAFAATIIQETQATNAKVKENGQQRHVRSVHEILKDSVGQMHSVLEAFDAVLLVGSDGTVLAQQPEAGLKINTLMKGVQTGKPEKSNDVSFATATAVETVRLAGNDYKLFVRPLTVDSSKSTTDGNADNQLPPQAALCGLVSVDAFRMRTWSLVSWSRLFIFVSALILVGWPFLKTSLVADTAQITRVDVAMVGSCGVVGLALFVLLVFDLHLYSRLNADIDVALQQFSQQIRDRFGDEIRTAYAQMEALELQMLGRDTADQSIEGDKLTYPYFLSVSLIDRKGMQDRKTWSGSTPDPPPHVNVKDRAYFSAASKNRQQLWTLSGTGAEPSARLGPLYVESVRSWQTGNVQAVIAKPAPSGGRFVATAIGMSLRSLIDPVAIPGFEFAVVDRSGLVLFHSDSLRNGSEQLFSATELDRRLMDAVTTETATLMPLTYRAHEHRAFVAPFKDAPWSVVTLYGQDDAEALNLEWLTTALALLALYFAWFIGGSLIILHAGRRHIRDWLWPSVDRAWTYRRAVSYYAWLSLLAAVAIYWWGPGQLIVVLAALPVAVWAAAALAGANSRKPRWIAAPVAKLIGRWLSGATPRTTYAIAVCLLVELAAVLPAVAAMKIAFTVRTTAFVQKMQLELAANARDRQRRDAIDYPTVSRPNTGNRYDSFFYGNCVDTVPNALAHFKPGAMGIISTDETIVHAMMSVFSFVGLGTVVRDTMPEGAANGSWDAHLSVSPDQTAARGLDQSWCRSRASGDRLLTLHSWAPAAFPFEDRLMRFESRLPSVFELRAPVALRDSSGPSASGTTVDPPVIDSRAWMLLWLAIAAITLLLLSVWVVRFFCRYILLFGIPEEGWKDEVPSLLPNDDSNLYVVRLEARASARAIAANVERTGGAEPAHYAALWESSSPRERIVLGHLARFGFVNSKAIGTLRHLWLRGLVKLDPAPRLMSDAFERYVLSPECRRDVDVAVTNTVADSSWTALKTPLLLVMTIACVFFVITQRDLLDMKAVVAGVMASLTPLLKEVIGQVISRRSAVS